MNLRKLLPSEFVIRPSATALVPALLTMGFVMWCLHQGAAANDLWREEASLPTFLAVTAGVLVLRLLLHEFAHGCAYVAAGLGWQRLTLAWVSNTMAKRVPETHRQMLVISAAGPLMEVLYGALILTFVGVEWSPLTMSGALVVFLGLVGLLVPVTRDSDGARVYRSLRGIASRTDLRIQGA